LFSSLLQWWKKILPANNFSVFDIKTDAEVKAEIQN
jgi:hypothetical protein